MKAKIHCTWLMRKTFAIRIHGIKQNKTEKKKTKYENKIKRNERDYFVYRLILNFIPLKWKIVGDIF